MRTVKTSAEHEAFYQATVAGMRAACVRYPNIRNIEIIAILGRMAGYCIAMCFPAERDLARKMLIENVDRAVAETAANAPSPSGRA